MNNIKETSNVAIGKAVLRKAAQQPVAVYPMALGVLGGFSALLFGINLVTGGLLAAGVVLGLGGFAAKYTLNKQEYANYYMQNIREKLIEKRQHILDNLEQDLSEVSELEGVKQIRLFQEKYENLLAILDKKLEHGELTHTRYLTIAEQVFLGGLDNLQNIALALKSISAIDIEQIERTLSQLDSANGNNQAYLQTLLARQQLYRMQLDRANDLRFQNETALTQLDHVTTKLANIKTEQGHAVMDIEDAMNELKILIERADAYSIAKKT